MVIMYLHVCPSLRPLVLQLQTVISGFQLCKTEKYLKDGQIMLLDCLFEICENQVTSRITVSEIEDIIRPRTIISMRLDGTYAVETDLGDFLKTGLFKSIVITWLYTNNIIANKHGATHIFALWPLDNSDSYGLTVKQNAKVCNCDVHCYYWILICCRNLMLKLCQRIHQLDCVALSMEIKLSAIAPIVTNTY